MFLVLAYVRDDKFILNPLPPKLDLRLSPSPYRFVEDLPDLSKRIVYVETSQRMPLFLSILLIFYRGWRSIF